MKHIITVFNELNEILHELKNLTELDLQKWEGDYNPLWSEELKRLDNACKMNDTAGISASQDRCITLIINDTEYKRKVALENQHRLLDFIANRFANIEQFFQAVKRVLRIYVALVCTAARNKEGEELFVLNNREAIIKRVIYKILDPFLELLQSKNPAYFYEIINLISKYMKQEDRLVAICINIFERIYNNNNDSDKAVTARRVFEKIGIAITPLHEQDMNASNFYNQLGVIDMKSGSVNDVISTIFSLDVAFSDENIDKYITIENQVGYSLTIYDEAVYNALSLLWLVGHENGNYCNEYITPRMVFQVLSLNFSKSSNNDCGDKSRDDIITSINALRETKLLIDVSDVKKEGVYKYYGSLLPSEWDTTIGVNNKIHTDTIHLLRCPPLYDYALKTGHISDLFIPGFIKNASAIEVPKFNASKREIIMIREYLLVNVLTSKNQGNVSYNVDLSKIYKFFNIPATSYKQQRDVRTRVKRSLEDIKQLGGIKDYAVLKEGARIIGYKVDI